MEDYVVIMAGEEEAELSSESGEGVSLDCSPCSEDRELTTSQNEVRTYILANPCSIIARWDIRSLQPQNLGRIRFQLTELVLTPVVHTCTRTLYLIIHACIRIHTRSKYSE